MLACVGSGIAQTVLYVTTDKTTSLVFPQPIKHVDRGTPAVLAQHLKETPTILLVKAAEKDFKETNLSVITDDGTVYAFTVIYNTTPSTWVHYLPPNKTISVARYAEMILDNPRVIKRVRRQNQDIRLALDGVYIKDDVIYYHLNINNDGPVDYNVDRLRFYTQDQRKTERTAVQVVEHQPLHVAGNAAKVKAYSKTAVVFALEKFTIPDRKIFFIQLTEKNGGRHLLLRVTNKIILKGILLPDVR